MVSIARHPCLRYRHIRRPLMPSEQNEAILQKNINMVLANFRGVYTVNIALCKLLIFFVLPNFREILSFN
jgi:hypothetical protein